MIAFDDASCNRSLHEWAKKISTATNVQYRHARHDAIAELATADAVFG